MTGETISSPNQVLAKTPMLEREESLQTAVRGLCNWFEMDHIDSIRLRNWGVREFQHSCEILKGLINEGASRGFTILLTIGPDIHIYGDNELPTHRFEKDSLGYSGPYSNDSLGPNDSLELTGVEEFRPFGRSSRNLYIGDHQRLVEMGELAQALTQGSELKISYNDETANLPGAEISA